MTTPTLPELKDLLLAARDYVEGRETIAGLNGLVSHLHVLAEERDVSVTTRKILAEWAEMIDRRWNEWGQARDPLPEQEFVSWLRDQFAREERLNS